MIDKQNQKTFLLFFCLFFPLQSWGFLDIRGIGLLNITDPSYQDAQGEEIGSSMRGGLGFGGIVGLKVIPLIMATEGGIIFTQRRYALDRPQMEQSWNYFEIPLGVRFYLSPFNFTGGFFLSQGMGQVTDKDGQGNKSSGEFEKKNLNSTGLGLYVGGAYEFNSILFSELRISKDFKNHLTTSNELKFTNFMIMFGAHLDLL